VEPFLTVYPLNTPLTVETKDAISRPAQENR